MIVYIESNFILEMALEQEQAVAAETIMALAEKASLKLTYPSFVLSEPFECLMRERRERNLLQISLRKSLATLQRSRPHQNVMVDLKPIIDILQAATSKQLERLNAIFAWLLAIGECIHIDTIDFHQALLYQQRLDLSPQDSIIYASVIADLRARAQDEEKCFLSRDRKAFAQDDDRELKAELSTYNCRYIGNFAQGLEYIQHTLQNAG